MDYLLQSLPFFINNILLCIFPSKFFNLKVILHLQLLQNIGYIPYVVQYNHIAYLTLNSLYLPLPYP